MTVYRVLSPWAKGLLCDRIASAVYGGGIAGKSIAPTRDGQHSRKVALDHERGKRAEFAFWRLLPEDYPAPDIEVHEDRSRCSYGADVGDFAVKLVSSYSGVDSWVFQKDDLDRGSGWIALMEQDGDFFRFAYLLNYNDARRLAADLVKPFPRKRCLYIEDLREAATLISLDSAQFYAGIERRRTT